MAEISDAEQTESRNNRLIGFIIGGIGAAMFSTKGIIIKFALMENVDAVTTLTWRMIIATPVFIFVGWLGFLHQKSKDKTFSVTPLQVAKSAAVGSLGYYVASFLDFQGLQYVTAQFDRLLLLTHPIWVVIIGAIAFRQAMSKAMIAGLVIAYAGLVLIFAHDLSVSGDNVVLGTILVLCAALSYAFYQLLAKPLIDQIGSRLFTSIAMTGAGFCVIVHFLLTHNPSDLIVSTRAMWLMFAIGTIATVFPAYFIAAAIGRIGPANTSILSNGATIVTIFLAVTLLGEIFTIYHAIGALMVLVGIFYFTRAERRATQALTAERMAPKL